LPILNAPDQGIPVYLVPGNHERSAIPHIHLADHPNIHIFDKPRTYVWQKDDVTLALAGFPFVRHGIRHDFLRRLDQTGWRDANADIQILCIHQSIDGATVGPVGYVFRYAPNVIKTSDIPATFSAVLSGHIHRFQILTNDLKGKTLSAPVFYPGAIQRTSFAEKNETKGYLILELEKDGSKSGRLKQWQFHQLPARPMVQLNVYPRHLDAAKLRSWVESKMSELPKDAIVKLKVHGRMSQDAMAVLRAASLRAIAPPTMNIYTAFNLDKE